jgi:hypothetical protein
VALVKPSSNLDEPYTLQNQAGKSGYAPGPDAISYRRENALYHDLPVMKITPAPPLESDPALLYVARSMRDMVAEARAERQDRMDSRDDIHRPKSVREKMGESITDRLLLLCQASSDEELPPSLM